MCVKVKKHCFRYTPLLVYVCVGNRVVRKVRYRMKKNPNSYLTSAEIRTNITIFPSRLYRARNNTGSVANENNKIHIQQFELKDQN